MQHLECARASRDGSRTLRRCRTQSADWADVRRSLLWAGGLRDLPRARPGDGYTGHCFADYNHTDLVRCPVAARLETARLGLRPLRHTTLRVRGTSVCSGIPAAPRRYVRDSEPTASPSRRHLYFFLHCARRRACWANSHAMRTRGKCRASRMAILSAQASRSASDSSFALAANSHSCEPRRTATTHHPLHVPQKNTADFGNEESAESA